MTRDHAVEIPPQDAVDRAACGCPVADAGAKQGRRADPTPQARAVHDQPGPQRPLRSDVEDEIPSDQRATCTVEELDLVELAMPVERDLVEVPDPGRIRRVAERTVKAQVLALARQTWRRE